MNNKPETITQQLQSMIDDFCNNFCKYAEEAHRKEDYTTEACDRCPFNRF